MLRDVLGRRSTQEDGADAALFMNTLGTNTNTTTNRPRDQHEGLYNDLNDIFGSAPSSPVFKGDSDAPDERRPNREPSDIPRLRITHVTNGYREGIAASKEKHIQDGFDEGWSLGGEMGLKAGWCLGALEGIRQGLTKAAKTSEAADEDVKSFGNVHQLLAQAQQELRVDSLFGREYFRMDGVSLFGIPVQEGAEEHEVTFSDLAAAHPVIQKWTATVLDLAIKLDTKLG